jgi:hypothetical protein
MFRLIPILGMVAMLAVHFFSRHRRHDDGHRQPGLPVGTPPGDVPDDVVALVRKGRKIQAIKAYQKVHGTMSLKEAKDVVDNIAER